MTISEDWIGGKQMPSFRLDRQPWIPVTKVDGVATSVNLIQVFCDATRISGLAGSPLEAAAITRFLLAIVHLVETPTTLDAWGRLWQNRVSLMSRCGQYVEAQAGVWDLFHEQQPFGQLPNLGKTLNPAHLLVYEAARKNNAVFADHSVVDGPAPIPAAVLARGLIVTNAYAGSSGGGYRSGALAMRTVAMLCGRTLNETLLLNLFVQADSPTHHDWKRYGHAVDHGVSSVDIVQRYLWTARRVRLIADAGGTAAVTMMLAPGDEMPESERTEDPMVVMRKDSKGASYVPLRLEAGRALWRSAHVLLNWHEDVRRLGAIDQLHKLVRRGFIPADQPVSMRVCGVAGEAQGPSSELWRDETLPFGLSVIADDKRHAELERAVSTAEDAKQKLKRRLWSFARTYLGLDKETREKRDPKKEAEDIRSFIGELVGFKKEKWGKETVTIPLYTDFWSAIAPFGERIACDGFEETAWIARLKEASGHAFSRAIDRLPPDARRYRAEFAHRVGSNTNQNTGGTA
jgi:CRISPR type I-E-associated protein CasA/Cse1